MTSLSRQPDIFGEAVPCSYAMLTEGVHFLVDTGNDLLLLYGARRSQRAADEWRPFGYASTTSV
ncbi:MAG: hypothetical protein H7274_04575 [Rhodoferax sp.]|nr:hypothetical protein [Rhodoferax sp.]